MTPTTTTPTAPAFDAQLPGEGWTDYGRRGLLYVLRYDTTFTVSDDGLEAAADYCNHAVTAPEMAATARERIMETQDRLRGLLRGRRADAAAVAALTTGGEAVDAPAPSQTPAQGPVAGGSGGGGSKVPRKPAPKGPAPTTGRQLAVPAGLRPVPALAAGADDLF